MTEFLETNGARIAYDVSGDGPAVVLIHAGVANRSMWDDQVAALEDAYRVIRHDTRGFGETETEAVAFSNRADIAALLDHLGEGSAHIVGLSRGGQIGLDFALEFPDRVRSVTVAAGGVGGYESPAELPVETWEPVEAMWKAKEWEALSDWETAFWADGPGQPADRVPEIRRRVHGWILENYLAEKEEGEPQPLDPPAERRLGDLRAPLLVMLGTLDEPSTTDAMRHLASSVPGARLEEFESAHMINLEHPERFNRALREFLDANGS
ncbi:MAG TPA: alpha/beta hydrolase [Patescibacteria group bacterium]|nr:alpha/beta hydrolase [Patescibacteria group bacterium]